MPTRAPLEDFIEAQHSHRLGHYFETLLEFWLQHLGVTHLRRGVQVMRAGQTLGEFDFVFQHTPWGGWQHWEVAVKFYLLYAPASGAVAWEHFVGPNPADRLADKLHKLFEHQLALADTPEGQAALALPARPRARALVKGWLFYPAGTARPAVAGLSNAALQGWWLHHGTAPLPSAQTAPRWKILHRLAWLAPSRADASETKTLFDTSRIETILARHFEKSTQPVLLAELAPDARGDWEEVARGFVVSPRWPEP